MPLITSARTQHTLMSDFPRELYGDRALSAVILSVVRWLIEKLGVFWHTLNWQIEIIRTNFHRVFSRRAFPGKKVFLLLAGTLI
jgi:hypothetical protein